MQTAANATWSEVMQSIKRNFTLNCRSEAWVASPLSMWQAHFWDHGIRDPEGLWQHTDYIRYGQVKHELVTRPREWPCSSFHFWRERGYYELGWGGTEPDHVKGVASE